VKGVIAATRGNFGQSVAFAAANGGLRTVIVVPHNNSKEKNAAMRALGAELIEFGDDFQDALEHAERLAREAQLHFVDSFNLDLVQGVASYALELFRGVSNLDFVYVNVDHIVTVLDSEIIEAMKLYFSATHNVAEGAAAAPLAALLQEQEAAVNKRVALIHSGSNVDRDLFASVLSS
jgi:threonine dehydratase